MNFQAATVEFDKRMGDGQTQFGASLRLRNLVFHLDKRQSEALGIRRGNSDADI